ncbi:MAG: hypothetical protein IH607_05125, partial [Firmicutes bacterium]|nr:hypothetical protein [Bacillota bacterium]
MNRLIRILAACMALPAMLGLVPGATAQSETDTTVVIGDGAPIQYLEGFESVMVQSTEQIRGITGAFSGVQVSQQSNIQIVGEESPGIWTFDLQTLVLTDDVLGLFFKQTYSQPIVYRSMTKINLSTAAMMPEILVDGEILHNVNEFKEARPIDAYSQYSFVLWSLPQPVKVGQVLTFGAQWNETLQTWEGGVQVMVDRSQADEPTVSYNPAITVQKSMALWQGSAAVRYHFTIDRVAYTPFGNRMLIRFTGTSEDSQYLDCILLDAAGNTLNMIPTMQKFQTNASAEHPVVNVNEVWFFGGEDSQSLTLIPLGGNWQTSNKARRMASVALDELPADIALENGLVLHVERCEIQESGFYVRYTTDGYAGYVDFDLGDANGNSLGFPFGSYHLDDHSRRLLGYGGVWAEEYKGETISRVKQKQLAQVKTLLIS